MKFKIGLPQGEVQTYKNARTCNWDLFRERLRQGLEQCPVKPKTTYGKYVYAIRKAKVKSWRKHCEEIEKTSKGARLQNMLQKDNQGKLGSLKKPQGGCTTSGEEILDLLLKTHFPGSTQRNRQRKP
ncbi:hypothetical protein NQ318_013070 [Aromia moschata]|uniref:Uncharacterized protein n=1 Tax=Aromia moschata TaxID=1265417 RepID=A0AAV8XDT8_9CUCU|nr:hypothetical protein NQ318_013070 [Aromia moschata]